MCSVLWSQATWLWMLPLPHTISRNPGKFLNLGLSFLILEMELKLLWQVKWVCMNGLPRIVSSMRWLLHAYCLVLLLFQFYSTRFMFSCRYLSSQRKQEPSWWQLVWPIAAIYLRLRSFPRDETSGEKSGRVLGKLGWLASLVAAHLSIPAGILIAGLFVAQEGSLPWQVQGGNSEGFRLFCG